MFTGAEKESMKAEYDEHYCPKKNQVTQQRMQIRQQHLKIIRRSLLCIAGQRQKTRDVSIQYFFRKEGVRTRVCYKFFTSTLNIDDSPMTEAIKGRGTSGTFVGVDNRGRHVSFNKIPESDLKRVREYDEHYCPEKNQVKQQRMQIRQQHLR